MDRAKAEITELKAKLASMQAEKVKMIDSNTQLKGNVRSLQL